MNHVLQNKQIIINSIKVPQLYEVLEKDWVRLSFGLWLFTDFTTFFTPLFFWNDNDFFLTSTFTSDLPILRQLFPRSGQEGTVFHTRVLL